MKGLNLKYRVTLQSMRGAAVGDAITGVSLKRVKPVLVQLLRPIAALLCDNERAVYRRVQSTEVLAFDRIGHNLIFRSSGNFHM